MKYFIGFTVYSKRHAHTYIQQTHVYYDGYNTIIDSTFQEHQCCCFFFFFLYACLPLKLFYFLHKIQINIHIHNMQTKFSLPLVCHIKSRLRFPAYWKKYTLKNYKRLIFPALIASDTVLHWCDKKTCRLE